MNQIEDRRTLPVFIHSRIDDMNLHPYAFRVYGHLCRRAGNGKAWPSYQSIGDSCFEQVSDKPETRRRLAIKWVQDLEQRGLIAKEQRDNNTNVYAILDPPDTPASDGESLASDGESLDASDGESPKGTPYRRCSTEGNPSIAEQSPQPNGSPDGDMDRDLRKKVFSVMSNDFPIGLNPGMIDGMMELVDHYGFENWERGYLACPKYGRGNPHYVVKAVVSNLPVEESLSVVVKEDKGIWWGGPERTHRSELWGRYKVDGNTLTFIFREDGKTFETHHLPWVERASVDRLDENLVGLFHERAKAA